MIITVVRKRLEKKEVLINIGTSPCAVLSG